MSAINYRYLCIAYNCRYLQLWIKC